MSDHVQWFRFQNLQDDFIKYYRASDKHRIDEIRLSRLSILYGAATLNRRIEHIFKDEETKGMVICAHLKHSKVHDFYIIAACLIYGYTLLHTNWHADNEYTLLYKLRSTNCRLVIVDDEIETESMIPDVKYLRMSDVYAESIYKKSLTLRNYLSLVESSSKDGSGHRMQEMLCDQSKHVGAVDPNAVMMITFSNSGISGIPRARRVTYGEMAGHFKSLEAMGAWRPSDVLVVFMTNPTYDFFTNIVLYYCMSRGNVYVYFLQRYMSTYWKILWESNEHAKNVFTQLGKSYKVGVFLLRFTPPQILSFLFPRQLEALLTLDEVAQECKLFAAGNAGPGSPLMSGASGSLERAGSDEFQDLPTAAFAKPHTAVSENADQPYPTSPKSATPSDPGHPLLSYGSGAIAVARSSIGKVSKYIFGKRTSSKLDPSSTEGDNANSGGEAASGADEDVGEGPRITKRNSSDDCDGANGSDKPRPVSLYIPKLHLKFSELRNVLCDKNVLFLLSGTHANYDLCRLFACLTGGKTPIMKYGCSEISPTLTLISPTLDQRRLMELYNIGLNNKFRDKHVLGHYIGTAVDADRGFAVVRSVDSVDLNFMIPCVPYEPGYFVCREGDYTKLLLPRELHGTIMEDGTYLGLGDVGFYVDMFGSRHFYWSHKVDHSIPRGVAYPYFDLLSLNHLMQQAICERYDLTEPVVRVETMLMPQPRGGTKIVCAVELITALRGEIAEDIMSTFLNVCKSAGLFTSCPVPDEIRVVSIPWAYKGSVNYPALRVSVCRTCVDLLSGPIAEDVTIMSRIFNLRACKRFIVAGSVSAAAAAVVSHNVVTLRWVRNDSMSPVLFALDDSRDLAVVIRASRFYRNDVVLYQHPNEGTELFGRLVEINASENPNHVKRRVPSGHCWVENDNPRSDEPDSNEFGAVSVSRSMREHFSATDLVVYFALATSILYVYDRFADPTGTSARLRVSDGVPVLACQGARQLSELTRSGGTFLRMLLWSAACMSTLGLVPPGGVSLSALAFALRHAAAFASLVDGLGGVLLVPAFC
ncbi:AMP-binding enzyme [Babesia ovata]|uniref:AMP-binding enzyme n=1 Tax=Babesia ovata TaxID=189622 RepID=A0A2H6KFW3_9APIC|nr:AMP-binding enzyme [Babesia ovata]GBE61885.1 AMP-binding enzyme [Babesia ovata]